MVLHNDAACREMAIQFAIQLVVTEANGRCFSAAVGENNAFDARPVSGRETHGARFARGVKGTAGQVEIAKRGAGGAYGADFGMGGRVAARDNPVPAFGDDLAFVHDDGTERAAFTTAGRPLRKFDGTGEKQVFCIHLAEFSGVPRG